MFSWFERELSKVDYDVFWVIKDVLVADDIEVDYGICRIRCFGA